MKILLIVGLSSLLSFASQNKCRCSAFAPVFISTTKSSCNLPTPISSSSITSNSGSRWSIGGDDVMILKYSKETSCEYFSSDENEKNTRGQNDNQILQGCLEQIKTNAQKIFITVALTLTLCFSSTVMPSSASDYGALTDEQRAVAEAWRIVDNNFFDRTFNHQDWFKVRQDAIKKKYKTMAEAQDEIDRLVSSLGDKYTRYLPPAKYRSIVDSATGTLAGVGVEISMDKDTGRIYVSDTEPSSPASMGGIRKGDTFLEVDGVKFDDGKSTPDDVASKLRGPEGSKVGIVMQRDGEVQDFILTREPITITSVRSYMSDKAGVGKVGVVRIKSFSGTTAQTVKDAIVDLKKKGAEALVLDLRGNPGGLLPGGVDTAALFLEANKPVVYVVDKRGVQDNQFTYQDGPELDTPLVVVVNSNTASAAEVMTAALKENQRATIVGEQTFGKGIIQTIRQLGYDNGGVAVTVARYETPLHNNINKSGIAVDFPVDCVSDDAAVCVPSTSLKK
mmetsp:Transcript_7154/g.13581  ORF Transcript_7154/g.13581 Transcript_7154/m.13581 type:complete len:506 (+) Transcript_7154:117-1634(+)|eukprot:CAMPEP_0176481046 /NCGR_PEP_ID=MMETSP0200_2-20121128/2605_1 /TAXON_ID=947934 /ORGANISM="Chaetoceros sp., Strain GSL56" /LENGTH=505 /DNA_ID=CAMNT_0017877213 /DNA_START=29 /DNA_END=1546 /DNA_ORIENTATION=-